MFRGTPFENECYRLQLIQYHSRLLEFQHYSSKREFYRHSLEGIYSQQLMEPHEFTEHDEECEYFIDNNDYRCPKCGKKKEITECQVELPHEILKQIFSLRILRSVNRELRLQTQNDIYNSDLLSPIRNTDLLDDTCTLVCGSYGCLVHTGESFYKYVEVVLDSKMELTASLYNSSKQGTRFVTRCYDVVAIPDYYNKYRVVDTVSLRLILLKRLTDIFGMAPHEERVDLIVANTYKEYCKRYSLYRLCCLRQDELPPINTTNYSDVEQYLDKLCPKVVGAGGNFVQPTLLTGEYVFLSQHKQ